MIFSTAPAARASTPSSMFLSFRIVSIAPPIASLALSHRPLFSSCILVISSSTACRAATYFSARSSASDCDFSSMDSVSESNWDPMSLAACCPTDFRAGSRPST